MQREVMEFDVLVVGAGPAGLSAAIRLKQLAQDQQHDLSVCVLEKGSEVGAHILSGAVFESRALDELISDWPERGAPLDTPVREDRVFFLQDASRARQVPDSLVPRTMRNHGNFIVSLGNLCRWLGAQAEALGVEVFPGFAAASLIYGENGELQGVVTGDMGVGRDGKPGDHFEPGMELRARYTLLAEGCRGHLGKQVIERFALDASCDAQHYGLGIKELWGIDPALHEPGLVLHGAGWPLQEHGASGGFFLYHAAANQVSLGLITDLNYANPTLSPYEEFQCLKHHPLISQYLQGGKRVSYGARAITKGGLNALPKQHFPGGLLLGCDAGTLNFAKIKGSHTAMKSGMLAAETVFTALRGGDAGGADLREYEVAFRSSWLYEELFSARNFGAALHNYGPWVGAAFNYVEQNLLRGKQPLTLHDSRPDHLQLKPVADVDAIEYVRPDGVLSFDRLSSVFLSSTNHEEDQPGHLTLKDNMVPLQINLARYAGPEQYYCPAGVYEYLQDLEGGGSRLQINAQNCLHCKTCDIKDPTQNIVWITPEGSGGPNYPNM